MNTSPTQDATLPARITYSPAEACKSLGISRTTLYAFLSKGRIEALKSGTRTLITAESLRAFVGSLPAFRAKDPT